MLCFDVVVKTRQSLAYKDGNVTNTTHTPELTGVANVLVVNYIILIWWSLR